MHRMRPLTAALNLAIFAVALGTASCTAGQGAESVHGADLSRLAGRWYVIARLPPAGEHRGFGAEVEYRLHGQKLEESYTAHTGSLDGPLEKLEVQAQPDPEQPSRWRIKEGWLGSKERLLLYVSPGYRRAIVTDGGHGSAWLLAREPEIPEWSLDGMLARLSLQGFDVSKLRRVVQRPEQVGKPGFE